MNDLLYFIIALTCFMVSNILSGVIKAFACDSFCAAELKKGVIKYILWLFSFILGFVAISFFPNIEIMLGEEMVSLSQAIKVAEVTIITAYAVKFFQNVFEYHNIQKEVKNGKVETE